MLDTFIKQLIIKGSIPYSLFYNKFKNNLQEATEYIKSLGYVDININPKRNWGTISIDSEVLAVEGIDVEEITRQYMVNKYSLKSSVSIDSDLKMKVNNRLIDSPIERSAIINNLNNTKFRLDINMLTKYQKEITLKCIQHMENIHEEYNISWYNSYSEIVNEIISQYVISDETYVLEGGYLDSRGRVVAKSLNKVLNPIGSTLGRALVILEYNTLEDINPVYEFIVELADKVRECKTINSKRELGKRLYKERYLVDNLSHRIWLERIYENLDTYRDTGIWNVPIEIDYSMSMGMITGLLTGDERLLDYSNVINPQNLKDAWYVPKVARSTAKLCTARFYGSSKSLEDLSDNTHKTKDINNLKKFLATNSRFTVIDKLKDLIINGSNVTEDIVVNINGELLPIYCNRFDSKGVTKEYYKGFDTTDNIWKVYSNSKPIKVPNYKAFRLYLFTLLIHNLDSQLLNNQLSDINNVIPIHDAIVCHPNKVATLRSNAKDELISIYQNKNLILKEYFESIGITTNYKPNNLKVINKYKRLQEAIVPFTGKVNEFSGYCMK